MGDSWGTSAFTDSVLSWTRCFHSWGLGSIPGQGTNIPRGVAKKKKRLPLYLCVLKTVLPGKSDFSAYVCGPHCIIKTRKFMLTVGLTVKGGFCLPTTTLHFAFCGSCLHGQSSGRCLDKGIRGPGSWANFPFGVDEHAVTQLWNCTGSHPGTLLSSSCIVFWVPFPFADRGLSFCGDTKPEGGLGQT